MPSRPVASSVAVTRPLPTRSGTGGAAARSAAGPSSSAPAAQAKLTPAIAASVPDKPSPGISSSTAASAPATAPAVLAP